MKTLVVRFSDRVSTMETTHQRLKEIAEHLGVSQNKAIQYAINKVYEDLDLDAEAQFKQHGVKVGGITYLNHPKDALDRVEARLKAGIPLPHEDDETLESNLLFASLSEEEKAIVRSTPDMLEKRRLIAGFLAAAQ